MKLTEAFDPISYQEFIDTFEGEMFFVECYDKDGREITEEIPMHTKVLNVSKRNVGDLFDLFAVVLDM